MWAEPQGQAMGHRRKARSSTPSEGLKHFLNAAAGDIPDFLEEPPKITHVILTGGIFTASSSHSW